MKHAFKPAVLDFSSDRACRYEEVVRSLTRSESGGFFADCLAERRVELCEGARVILLFNLDLEERSLLRAARARACTQRRACMHAA
eukprot:1749080-Pleurochrysis_carterae.AAC.1